MRWVVSAASTTTTPRPVRKGWRDLAAAIGCDKLSETGSRADLHGYTSPLRFQPRVAFTLDQYTKGLINKGLKYEPDPERRELGKSMLAAFNF